MNAIFSAFVKNGFSDVYFACCEISKEVSNYQWDCLSRRILHRIRNERKMAYKKRAKEKRISAKLIKIDIINENPMCI